ncbi:hypothetical protein ABW19_dt0204917 [Dactylella cylindrospora]|nr:hypothetical protein ABW19_dt0204917 [Dactylella cylindrospora]
MTDQAPTTTATSEPLIDTSPTLSPHSQNTTLESRLSRRPEAQDLVNRNILQPTTTSPSLQQQKHDLEHAMIVDNLKKGLAHRPDREELEARGILPDDKIAPALLGQKKELEKSMLTDSLNTKLARRPTTDEVIEKGILNADEDPRTPQ